MNKLIVIIMLCGILFAGVLPVHGEENMITKGSKVTLNYTLTVDGQKVESTEGKTPLEYTHGEGNLIPGFEKGLEGMKANDTKKITVATEEAYGPRVEDRIVEVPKATLSKDVDPKPGMILQMMTEDGQPLTGSVVEVKEESLLLDFNHPLAGKELTFDITVVSVN